MAIQFVNNVDFNANQAQSIRIENLATDPSTELVIGRIIFNTSADTLKQYVANAGGGSPGWVEVGGGVTSVGLSMPAAFTVANSPVTSTGTLTVTGSGTTSQYVDGTGALQTFPTIPTVPSNIVETITTTDGTYINLTPNTATDGAVTITADLSAADGTAASGERYLTKSNTWATIASIPGTYEFEVSADTGTSQDVQSGDTLGINGGTNINTEVAGGPDITINLDDSISLAGSLTVGTTGSFTGQVTIPQVPSANTDAASKHYVDQAVTGALSYQGGYDAANNVPDLDSSPSSSIKKGWTYTVTSDGSFFTEQVRVGDVLIAEVDAPTALADWTTVQNNIDLADLSTVGIGNVNAATANDLLGIDVSYSSGTASVGLDVDGLTEETSPATDDTIAIYDTSTSTNKKATLANIASAIDISKGVRTSLDGDPFEPEGAWVTRTEAGGLTTFAIAVNNSFLGLGATSALDVTAEITTAAGQTVYADITRSGTTLNVIFTGSVANGTYSALLVDVG